MQLHNLKRNIANRKAKQVGRGGTRGKTTGRGTKGQNARTGRKKRPEMRDIIKRLPKLRGRGKNSLKSRFAEALPVKISVLESQFADKAVIDRKALLDKGIIKIKSGKMPVVKILADKKISKTFVFENIKISKGVKNINGSR